MASRDSRAERGLFAASAGCDGVVQVPGPFQRQRVDLPSGVRYWSVLDGGLELVPGFDRFLFEERFARGRSEKTTAQYASGLVAFADWAVERSLLEDLVACARNLGMFQLHLRTTPISRVGCGHGKARSSDRVADIMGCVRSFYRFGVRHGVVPSSVNELLYDVVEPPGGSMPWLEDLPAMVARPVHTLPRSGESEPADGELGGVRRDDGRAGMSARQAVDLGAGAGGLADRAGAGSAAQRSAFDGELAGGGMLGPRPASARACAGRTTRTWR